VDSWFIACVNEVQDVAQLWIHFCTIVMSPGGDTSTSTSNFRTVVKTTNLLSLLGSLFIP
jgi:hypothetical protein